MMKAVRFIVVMVALLAFASATVAMAATEFYVVKDAQGKVSVVDKKPEHATSIVKGPFATKAEAEKALAQTGGTALQGWQRSSQIIGTTVSNPQGEKLGKIDDVLIDPNGAVKYAILSHGGLLGIGDKLIPIPWRALKLDKEKGTLVVNADKAALEKAPSFDPKEWPKVIEPESLKKIDLYYK